MRRALAYSSAFHVGLGLVIVAAATFDGHRLPDQTPITIDIIELSPQRVNTQSSPAQTAPVPKREAAAVNPAPRTEQAPPERQVRPVEIAPPEARPEPPQRVEAKPEPSVQPTSTPAPAAPIPPPDPRPEPPERKAVASVEVDRPVPRPSRPPTEAAKPAAKAAESKPAETTKAEPAPPAKPAKEQPSRTAKTEPAKAEKTPPAPAKPAVPKKVEARTEEAKKPAPKEVQVAAKPTTPEKAPSKPAEDSLDALLKSVENQAKRLDAPEKREGRGQSLEPVMTASQQNQLRASAQRQMEDCWRIPTGLRGADTVQPFPVNVKFNPDGTARAVRLLEEPVGRDASVARIVGESAQRAAWSCRLSLPPEFYAEWQDINFNFDPKQAVAG
jgi:hypothetical protein